MSAVLPASEERTLVAGDKKAFEVLVRHHADRLYAVVLRFSATEADAEEATQEAFLRAGRTTCSTGSSAGGCRPGGAPEASCADL